jgi:hypothetical protein
MRPFLRYVFAVFALLTAVTADAQTSFIGKIQMIYPYLPQGLVYVHMQGYPTLNGGACPSQFFVAQMNDANFKAYVYSALLAAKASNADVRLVVDGCLGTLYPLIAGVEYSPRQ